MMISQFASEQMYLIRGREVVGRSHTYINEHGSEVQNNSIKELLFRKLSMAKAFQRDLTVVYYELLDLTHSTTVLKE